MFALLLTACSGTVTATPQVPATAAPLLVTITPASTPPVLPATPTAAGQTSAASSTAWTSLAHRPLHLPSLAAGAPCPVTAWQPASRLIPGNFGPGYLAFGSGPIYPIIYGFDPHVRAVPFATLPIYAEASRQDKVLWIAAPSYRQPAIIHGRRLDAPAVVQIAPGGNAALAPQLRFPIDTGVSSADTAQGWRDQPSFMLLSAPGCYGFQIDGLSFSKVIVFTVSA